MKTKMVLVGGAVLMTLSAAIVVACSSSNDNPPVGGQGDADSGSTAQGTDSGPSQISSSDSDSGSTATTDAGGGTTTCKIPTLHPNPAGDVYCGFSDAGSLDCLSDSGTPQCCLGGTISSGVYAPQECVAFGESCTNGSKALPIECGQTSDCAANGKAGAACCLQGVTSGPAPVANCPASDLKQQGGTGIVCEMGASVPVDSGAATVDSGAETADGGDAGAASMNGGGMGNMGNSGDVPTCAAGEYQVCAQQSDCPSGKTCTPAHWKLYAIGFCL